MTFLSSTVVGGICLFGTYLILKKLRERAVRQSVARKNGCVPPRKYAHRDPILGLDLLFAVKTSMKKSRYLRDSQSRYEVYGRTFQTNLLGAPVINTIEPENLKTMLATSFDNFGFGPLRNTPMMKELWGKGILTEDGPYWHHSRALIRPTFTRAQISDFTYFRTHINRLVDLIPSDGTTVDMEPLFKRYILDSSTEFLLGESVDSLLPETTSEVHQFLQAFDFVSINHGRYRHLGPFMFKDKEWSEAVKTVHAFIDKHVARVREAQKKKISNEDSTRKRYIVLEEMASLTDDPLELRHQILHVFIPGHESTGVLLSAVFYILARRPDVWHKLRLEISSSCPDEPTYDRVKNMHYLRYVLNETLRLESPFFAGAQLCFKDTIFPVGGGTDGQAPLYVQKGQVINFDLRSLHRDKRFWGEDAEEFRPERWEKARPTWEYLPFLGGPRVCLAQQLVLVEAGYVIIRVLQQFTQIESRDMKPWQEDLKLSVRNKHGVKVGLIPA